MPADMEAICACTCSAHSCTPGSDDDSARTRRRELGLAGQGPARPAEHVHQLVGRGRPAGGDWASRPWSLAVHSVMAAASRWSLDEK